MANDARNSPVGSKSPKIRLYNQKTFAAADTKSASVPPLTSKGQNYQCHPALATATAAAARAVISSTPPLPGVVDFSIGNDPEQWRTGIKTYAKVRYRDVYPGVDLPRRQ